MSSLEETGVKPESILQAEVDAFFDELPPVYKVLYIDVLILYAEDNRERAEKFRDHLINDIDIGEDGPVKAMLYDEAGLMSLSNLKIGHLAAAVERSTYIFMYLTKEFTKDKWMEFSSESCLMEAITNPDKQWCVVPVYTERRNTTFKVPMGLNTLKGISFYNNDKYYRQGLARLIVDKVKVRKRNNERLLIEQKKWIEKFKREKARQRENQLRTKLIEERMTQNFINAIQYETQQYFERGVQVVPPSMSSRDPSSNPGQLHHSQSESSLKPARPQNPAVQQNIDQMMHPTSQNSETHPQVLNRGISNQSTVYGDMGNPSNVSVQLQTQHGVFSVEVPPHVWSQISHLPENQRQKILADHFEKTQSMCMQRSSSLPCMPGMSSIGGSFHIDPQSLTDSSQTMEKSRNVQSYNAMAMQIPPEILEKIKEYPPEQQEELKQFYFKQMQEGMQNHCNQPNWADLSIRSQQLSSQSGPNSEFSQPSLHSNNGRFKYRLV